MKGRIPFWTGLLASIAVALRSCRSCHPVQCQQERMTGLTGKFSPFGSGFAGRKALMDMDLLRIGGTAASLPG